MTDLPSEPGSSTPVGNTATATPPATTRYRRSREDRMLAGVCGGLAHTLGIDPIVLRVAVVVLSFFGGAGIVVYVAGWLLMPDGDDEQALAQRVLGRRLGERRTSWLLVGLLAVAVTVSLQALFGDHRGPWHPVIGLLVLGAVLFARKRGRGGFGNSEPAQPSAPVPPAPMWTPPPAASAAPAAPWDMPTQSLPPTPAPSAIPLAAAPAKTPRSRLGTSMFCIVLLALGVLAAVDALGVDVPLPTYPATVVAGAGLGLLIGTWYGRARGLIWLGLLGLLALPPTAFAEEFHGGFVHGTQEIAPTTAGELLPQYEYRGGEVRLDLSRLDLSGQDAHSTVRLGAGELIVTVPAKADVTVHVRLNAGQYETFDTEDGGVDLTRTVHDDGPDGPGGGTLELTIRQGVGHVEVQRASFTEIPRDATTPTDAATPTPNPTEAPDAAA